MRRPRGVVDGAVHRAKGGALDAGETPGIALPFPEKIHPDAATAPCRKQDAFAKIKDRAGVDAGGQKRSFHFVRVRHERNAGGDAQVRR